MRRFLEKCALVAGQHGGLEVEAEALFGVGQRFQKPDAEEPGAAGDEKARMGKFRPDILRIFEDMREIGGGEGDEGGRS
jgi:hypothetical protein